MAETASVLLHGRRALFVRLPVLRVAGGGEASRVQQGERQNQDCASTADAGTLHALPARWAASENGSGDGCDQVHRSLGMSAGEIMREVAQLYD